MTTHKAIWEVVQGIPSGKVTTYGEVAKFVGLNPKTDAKVVGNAMRRAKEDDLDDVPWHRVLATANSGRLAKISPQAPNNQRCLLQKEGVKFEQGDRVSLQTYGWSLQTPKTCMKTHYQQQPPFEPPDKIGANGRIGLVALATDVNSEADLRRMAPDGVEIFTNRVSYRNPLTKQSLLAMAPDISRAASDLVPGFALDVLIYACTSGTAVIGEAEVMRLLRAGQSDFGDLPCTTPVTAALAALACFSAKKISILTPYIEPVNRELVGVFQSRDIQVINIHGFDIVSDTDMTGVTHESIFAAACDACDQDADVLFISCTALRAAQVVERIEASLNKPVITSNQAIMWHALKLLKRPFEVDGFGRLFEQ